MSTLCFMIATLLIDGIVAETLPVEWSIMTADNQQPPSVDKAPVNDSPVITLQNGLSPLNGNQIASGSSEYQLIPPHTLHNHLQLLSLLNLQQGPEQANEAAPSDNLNPLMASSTYRYPKIEPPPKKIENSLEQPPMGGKLVAVAQMNGGRPIPNNNVLPFYADSYNMINYFNPEPNDLNSYKVPQAPDGPFPPLYVDEVSTTEAPLKALPNVSDANLLDLLALNEFVSSVTNAFQNSTDMAQIPPAAADANTLAIPALNQFISSIPTAFPALQAAVPDVTLNPLKPTYMMQLASSSLMAPPVNVRNVSDANLNSIPVTTSTTTSTTTSSPPTAPPVIRANSTTLTAVSVPVVGAPSIPTVGLTTPLLSAIATIISDIATAISAFVTSLANSGTFTTALNGVLDFIISITVTPLCTASTDTKRAVVLLLSILVALAIIKLKKCEKKSCYSHSSYYRSLNDITISKEGIEEKISRVMQMIQSLSKDTDYYR